MLMWEENPKYQHGIFRLLMGAVLLGLVLGPVIAVWTGDWSYYRSFLFWVGVVVAALCIYAGSIWLVAHLIRRAFMYFKQTKPKDNA